MEEKARKSWQDKWKFLEKDNIEKVNKIFPLAQTTVSLYIERIYWFPLFFNSDRIWTKL